MGVGGKDLSSMVTFHKTPTQGYVMESMLVGGKGC